MPEGLSLEGEVDVPVVLTGNGHAISAAVFSVEYDIAWLQLDGSDADGDAIADAVILNVPPQFSAYVAVDETAGVVDIMVADLTPPLSTLNDGTLATLQFNEPNDTDKCAGHHDRRFGKYNSACRDHRVCLLQS